MRETFEIELSIEASKCIGKMNEGVTVFDDEQLSPISIPDSGSLRNIVPWGEDNLRPNEVIRLSRNDEVMASNMFFNINSGYGNGLSYTKKDGMEIVDQEVIDFFMYNRYPKYLMEQWTDMKHFFFTVSVIILSGDGNKIVSLRHKDALYCRFETCNPIDGKIEHVVFGNWEKGAPKKGEREIIELLDVDNPLGDLMVRMGKLPNAAGLTQNETKVRKFAMVNKIPIPGNKYYPFPYYWAIFNSGWYDIKQMIPQGKKAKFKNGMVIRYQVEINRSYWDFIFESENITDPVKRQERITLEKENIKAFLSGMTNAGKVWFSGFYVDPTGKEQSLVRINVINQGKEGGDWIEDVEEGSSMMCYAQGVHPSSIGATPGKNSSNMNGSNVREIFTMHQALEKASKDILLEPYYVIAHYNKWDIKFEIPFMMLTTLDKGTDAVEANSNNTKNKKQ